MSELVQKVASSLRRGECIALDAEFTARNEMLELAVMDLSFDPIFESLFTPARSRRWSKVPHGITPAMVKGCPKFAWRVPRVQRIINKARFIIGFALENDITHLKAERIERLDTKRVLDLRDWFWLVYGRHHGFDYREGVSLVSICEELQVTDDGDPHRARYDTACTLRCFRMLFERFVINHGLEECDFDEVVAHFDREFAVAMDAYKLAAAAGFISLVVNAEGSIMIKPNKERQESAEGYDVKLSVPVTHRFQAMASLSQRLGIGHRTGRILLREITPDVIDAIREVQSCG